MSSSKILGVTTKLVSLLEPLDSEERARAIHATFVMLGDTAVQFANPGQAGVPGTAKTGAGTPGNEKLYFDTKNPTNKLEELAVAARFREETGNAASSTKQDLCEVVKAARRNFDTHNFRRDLHNAKTKGVFNKGNGTDIVLSHYGQSYVDLLPDREAIKALKKPKGAGARRPVAKKVAKATLAKK